MRSFTVKPQGITAAEGADPEEQFLDALDEIKDNADFALEGLAKLSADGYRGDAEQIANQLNDSIDSAISAISAILAE